MIDVAPNLLTQGSLIFGMQTGISCPFSSSIKLEIKWPVNACALTTSKNHPSHPTLQFVGKSVFHEIGPWCQKKGAGDRCITTILRSVWYKNWTLSFWTKEKRKIFVTCQAREGSTPQLADSMWESGKQGQRALELRVGAPEILPDKLLFVCFIGRFFPNFSFASTDILLLLLPSFPTAAGTFPFGCPVVTLNLTHEQGHFRCSNSVIIIIPVTGLEPESPWCLVSPSLSSHISPQTLLSRSSCISHSPQVSFPRVLPSPGPGPLASCLDCCSEQACLQTLPGLTLSCTHCCQMNHSKLLLSSHCHSQYFSTTHH